MNFRLRNVPLLSRVGADRADHLRTDVDAAVAGWGDAVLLRVDDRNQVLVVDERVLLAPAADLGDTPPPDAVFLGRIADGRHVWAPRWRPRGMRRPARSTRVAPGFRSTMSAPSWWRARWPC
jgi:NAD+ diphosphatase